jgi:predicted O-linked N-acetylglucosamine transferase (SPINDLY family)
VGYLSGDLFLHPVTFFLIPVLEHHDRAQVEVFCYSFGQIDDGITRHLRQLAEHWRDAATLTDAQLADAIHADGIDVLVDLAGHTERTRLGVFCQRPAPAQVAWLGYLNTTGLTHMDYRLCDVRTDPVALSQALHTERLVHLPESQWCYRPMVDTAIEPVAPVERNGFVTFGSFNAALKISSRVTRRWGEAMARLPGSRLVVCNAHGMNKRAAMLRDLEAAGVVAERVEFLPRVGLDKYLGLFNRVDISLDTFPYGGGTTTLDSLWMGVPVLAAMGDTPVSRSAASVLQLLGMDDWVASELDAFVDVAVARASDTGALASLRRDLRPRMQASALTDMPRFVRDLEAAYGRMRDGSA